MKRLAIACTALTVACATACGGLPDHEGNASTLVTLHGSVQSQSGALSGADVHVALIWESSNGNDTSHALAVDAPVKAEFPASFSLPVTSPPPSGFVLPNSKIAGAKMAVGMLIAYDDQNKNGKLDLLEQSSTQAIDKVVGTDKTNFLVYVESAPNGVDAMKDDNGAVPRLGFNILKPDAQGSGFVWQPISTDLTLTEDDSADAQSFMCKSGGSSESGVGTVNHAPVGEIGPNGAYPAPTDPNLYCDSATPDQYSYTEDTLTLDRPCEKQYTSITTVYSKQSGTSPAGWPCQ